MENGVVGLALLNCEELYAPKKRAQNTFHLYKFNNYDAIFDTWILGDLTIDCGCRIKITRIALSVRHVL
jgi:hypothetical protein